MFGYLKLAALLATLVGGWFIYGWGMQIIDNYSAMSAKIALLERDKKLIESRVASYQELLRRRDEAIAASKCNKEIEYFVQNPEKIPRLSDPFNPSGGN